VRNDGEGSVYQNLDLKISKDFSEKEENPMKGLVRIIAVSVLVLFATSSLVYAGQFGPPEPAAKEGKVSIGTGYFYYSAKWEDEEGDEVKLRSNEAYLQLSYSFIKGWEVYGRVGGTDIKFSDVIEAQPLFFLPARDFKDGLKLFGTLGLRGLLYDSPKFGIGPFFQYSRYGSHKDDFIFVPEYIEAKFKDRYDISGGLSLQAKFGSASIYGGPVFYRARAEVEVNSTNILTGATGTRSFKIKEKGDIGGFAGLRLPLTKNLNFEVEGQLKSKFSVGGALTYSF